jgi:transposase-like protein
MKKEGNILTDDQKRHVVLEVLSGKITKEEARRKYGIKSKSGILDWMRKYAGMSSRSYGQDPLPILRDMDKSQDEKAQLEARIAELEQELASVRLKGKAYQIMVELAKEEYGLDLEKKSGAKQSKDSKK